ncbi:MAG: hypothetical protein HOH19_07390 [Kordiimonadaceae bacterium]|jgi:hypothetical protein|nr:hypothetical protein [Kordiimonadaceae bacterium]
MKNIILIIILSANITGCTSIGFRCDTLPVGSTEQRKCFAIGGDKNVQYSLGKDAYIAGDTKTALRWLKMATKPILNTQSVYVPAVGGQKYGTVMVLNNGMGSNGHAEAKVLIERIRENENNNKNN